MASTFHETNHNNPNKQIKNDTLAQTTPLPTRTSQNPFLD